ADSDRPIHGHVLHCAAAFGSHSLPAAMPIVQTLFAGIGHIIVPHALSSGEHAVVQFHEFWHAMLPHTATPPVHVASPWPVPQLMLWHASTARALLVHAIVQLPPVQVTS